MKENNVTVSEAKTHFFEISEKASQGVDTIILKRGTPQSVVISYEKYAHLNDVKKSQRLEVLEQIRKFRSQQKKQPDSVPLIRAMREDPRKW